MTSNADFAALEEIRRTLLPEVRTLLSEEVAIYDPLPLLAGSDSHLSRVVALVRDRFGVELDFSNPTLRQTSVAKLAERIYLHKFKASGLPDFPLTDLQQGYWVGETAMYQLGRFTALNFVELDLDEQLDIPRLEAALEKMVGRHEMLRATINQQGLWRILGTAPRYKVPFVDLSKESDQVSYERLEKIREEMRDRGATTESWPLFDIRVTKLNNGKTKLHFGLCLLLIDAHSSVSLAHELLVLHANPDLQLEAPEYSFRDFIIGQSEHEKSERFQESRKYWVDRLETLPPPPDIPVTKSLPQGQRPRFSRLEYGVQPSAKNKLAMFAAKSGLSLNSVICTAFAEIISAWSKSQRFSLNVLTNARSQVHPKLQSVIGNFGSTFLLEVDFRKDETFTAKAQRLQKQLWSDFAHSSFNGVKLGRELTRAHGSNSRPWGPIVFASTLGLTPPGRGYRKREIFCRYLQTPQVLLDHQIYEIDGWLSLSWTVVEDQFPDGMIEDMFAAYGKYLEELAANEESWTRTYNGFLPVKQAEVRARVNSVTAPISGECLHTLFRRSATEFPDRVAAIDGELTLTYGQLLSHVVHYAERLRESGVKPGSLVGIIMDKGWEQVVAALAIHFCGSAYVPIDPKLPKDRVDYLLQNSGAKIALTQPWVEVEPYGAGGVQSIVVSHDPRLEKRECSFDIATDPGALAYLIYTSGSTGVPKGVMIAHEGAVNTVIDINRRWKIGSGDRAFAISSFGFDLSVFDVFGMLAAGGAIVFPDRMNLTDPAFWVKEVQRNGVSVWNSVPAFMKMLVEHLRAVSERLPGSMRLIMMSGDWIPIDLPPEILRLGDRHLDVVSLGGATEASIWSNYFEIKSVDPAWKSIPYGVPLTNQQFHVLNETGAHCPDWVPGYLFIGGTGLAKGYWSDKEKTEKSFYPHPKLGGARLYKTGDLGRYYPDGNIEFLGREDSQVKIQGYRIELAEVEAAIQKFDGVHSVLVNPVTINGAKRLAAYAIATSPVPQDRKDAFVGELREFISGFLPEYMIPSYFEVMDAFPLSRNGKVDRGALPKPGAKVESAGNVKSPVTEMEIFLARAWKEILGIPEVGTNQSFFDLGGDSLLAVRLMAVIRKTLQKELALASLFQSPTIAQLANLLERQPEKRRLIVPIQTSGKGNPLVLVHPIGGNVLCYAELAKALGSEQAIMALQSRGLIPGMEPASSIPEMAGEYVAELKALQPAGPYFLGGWSMGGLIALEMARILRKTGSIVGSVTLIDSPVPARGDMDTNVFEAHYLSKFAQELGAKSPPDIVKIVSDIRETKAEVRLELAIERLWKDGFLPLGTDLAETRFLFRTFIANARALEMFRMEPYEGEVLLIEARQAHSGRQYLDEWRQFLSKTPVALALEADHYTIVKAPHIPVIAAKVKELLLSRT